MARSRGSSRRRPAPSATRRGSGSTSHSSRMLARVLDDAVRIPGTRFGVGLDALIGLIPGIGDGVGTIISSYILIDAIRNRVPLRILARMGFNVLFDAVLGLLPGVGDLADAAHRANLKNLRLLEKTLAAGEQVDTDVRGYLVRASLLVAVVLASVVALAVLAIWALLRLIAAV